MAPERAPKKGAPKKGAPPRIGRPIQVPVAATFSMKVETKPRFPNAARPAASAPAEVKDLSVTIQPQKKEFAGNGPLAFDTPLDIFHHLSHTHFNADDRFTAFLYRRIVDGLLREGEKGFRP